ncbi:MAG: PEP-CTERM sorting domain-containing protein [Leptospirales bacterium]
MTHISDPSASAAYYTEPYGINDKSQIVGIYNSSSGPHGFLDTNGRYTPINDPLATFGTDPRGINNLGQIVGYYKNASGTHGFIDNGGVFSTINDPLAPNNTSLYGINDSGQIVGDAGTSGFIASTPEPGTVVLFGTGILVMTLLAFREHKPSSSA